MKVAGSSESTEVAFELPEVQPRFAFQQNFGLSGVTHCNPGHRYVQTLVFDIRFIFYKNIRVRAFTLVTQASTDNVESKCSFSEFLQDRNEH